MLATSLVITLYTLATLVIPARHGAEREHKEYR